MLPPRYWPIDRNLNMFNGHASSMPQLPLETYLHYCLKMNLTIAVIFAQTIASLAWASIVDYRYNPPKPTPLGPSRETRHFAQTCGKGKYGSFNLDAYTYYNCAEGLVCVPVPSNSPFFDLNGVCQHSATLGQLCKNEDFYSASFRLGYTVPCAPGFVCDWSKPVLAFKYHWGRCRRIEL